MAEERRGGSPGATGRPARLRYRVTDPLIADHASATLERVLDEGYLSPGEWVPRFERAWAGMVGTRFAVATNSGTAALHLALLALGIGPGDEVIVPALTCSLTLNAVSFAGATPVIVDVDPGTLGMDPAAMAAAVGPRTAAVLPVHLYGAPVGAGVFAEARRHGLAVVEDACEAHGARQGSRMVGSIGAVGCFSFRGDKAVAIGTGGMLVTDDARAAERARYLVGLASRGGFDRYDSTETEYPYEMSNLHAALGLAQATTLEAGLAVRRLLVEAYTAHLSDAWFEKPSAVQGHSWWRYTPRLRGFDPRVLHARLLQRGIETMPPFVPMYRIPRFAGACTPSDFPVAEDVYARAISLPLSPRMTEADVEIVAAEVQEVLAGSRHRATARARAG